MIVEKLPQEIIQKILIYVEKKELQNLLYICKKWHHLVKAFYFEKITWRTKEKILQLKQHLAVMNENKKDIPVFRQLPMTKRLHIFHDTDHQSIMVNGRYTSPSTQFTEKEFLYLLSLFPDLRFLDVMQSEHRGHYLKILRNAKPTELPPLLEEIVTDGDYLDERDGDPRIQEFATCYQFRQSLKYMTLSYFNDFIYGKSFLELLTEFKNLSNLRIDNNTQPDLTFFDLLQACPSLSSLVYTSTDKISENATQQLANMLQNSKEQKKCISRTLKKLKKIELSIPTLTTPYADFFINHYPENLNEVDIYLTDTGMYRWIDDISMSIALNFCKSVQKSASLRLRFDMESVMDHSKIDTFHQILDAITGERVFKNHSVTHKDCEDSSATGVEIEIIGSELYYGYCLDVMHCNATDENGFRELPSTAALKQFDKANELDIWSGNKFHELNSVPTHYLDYAKSFFPKIAQFQFSCCYSEGSLGAKCLSSYQSLENMTHISIDGFEYPPEAMDDLPKYFPKVEVLVFRFPNLFLQTRRRVFRFTSFKHLQTFVLVTKCNSYFESGSLYLQYKNISEDGHMAHYSLQSSTQQGSDVSKTNFEPVSAGITQDYIKSNEAQHTYSIFIEGSAQLKRIELKRHDNSYNNSMFDDDADKIYASLDL